MQTTNTTQPEQFLTIKGYPDYRISSKGYVMSYKRGENILKAQKDRQGYLSIHLSNPGQKPKRFKIHKLVAEHFLSNSNRCVNHIDGNKLNNDVSNLEYCTYRENRLEAIRLGLLTKTIKENRDAKREVCIYDPIDDVKYYVESLYKAAKLLNVTIQSIYNCCTNRQRTVKGFIINYANNN
jgi:hypothetical protein